MTLSVTPQASPLAGRLVAETVAGVAPDNNVLGGAGSLFAIDVDNSANVAPVYLKLFDNAAPVVGTTPADFVFKVPASARRFLASTEGLPFTTALSFACVGGADQANVIAPTNPVIVRLVTS